MRAFVIASILSIACLTGCSANNTMTPKSPEQMQMLGQPSDAHKVIAPLAGKWEAKSKWWMKPGAEPMISKAKVERVMILGQRFLREKYTDLSKENPFVGIGMTGYDNVTNKYQSTWIDTMGTSIHMSKGELAEDGKTIKWEGTSSSPATGEEVPQWGEMVMIDKNTNLYKMYTLDPNGEKFQVVEITYKRKS